MRRPPDRAPDSCNTPARGEAPPGTALVGARRSCGLGHWDPIRAGDGQAWLKRPYLPPHLAFWPGLKGRHEVWARSLAAAAALQ